MEAIAVRTEVSDTIFLRAIDQNELEVLFKIFSDCRLYSLNDANLCQSQHDDIVRQQFDLEAYHYKQLFPNAQYYFICLGDSVVGRVYVSIENQQMRILDIGILSNYRRQGIARSVLTHILSESSQNVESISLQVSWFSQEAFNLYQSLGFECVQSTGIGYEMKYKTKT